MSESDLSVAEPVSASAPAVVPAPEKPVVLALENVSKRFCRDLKRSLFYGLQDIGREVIGLSQPPDTLRKNEFWAVRDVNLELRAGDAVGIVGINGCGKTTLMRIIAGLIKPTTGRVIVHGRLAPLLALGAGFNPVLTGRENIFVNMAILGLSREEIVERFDSVVDFSEIGYAIDAPVQTYSSGMVARLGFACAIATQPDILLLDEVLAVGDINFRRKCLERLFQMRSTGMSLIMVHHSPGILLSIAQTALYLERGRVLEIGDIGPVIQKYQRDLTGVQRAGKPLSAEVEREEDLITSEEAALLQVDVEAVNGGAISAGEDAVVIAKIRVDKPIEQLNFTAHFFRQPDLEALPGDDKPRQVLKMISRRDGGSVPQISPGEYTVRILLPSLGLLEGTYYVNLRLSRPVRVTLAARSSLEFEVTTRDPVPGGSYFQRREWSVISSEGRLLETATVKNSVETADDLMDMEVQMQAGRE